MTIPMHNQDKGRVYVCDFAGWRESVRKLLDKTGLAGQLTVHDIILIKPNLVEALQPPITTPVACVAAIVDYLQEAAPEARILIGEGTGALAYDTWHCFEMLGYSSMAREKGVGLVDLNEAELLCKTRPEYSRWPEMYLPRLVFDSYLISVPVLKAHSLAGVTLTMKNMMGTAPPAHYQMDGHWKKASFHMGIQEAIFELNRYRCPDFTILDATVGMQTAHLWGPTCKPPPNKLVAGFDPVAVDAFGCRLLKRDFRDIGHIAQAHQVFGLAEPLEVVEVCP